MDMVIKHITAARIESSKNPGLTTIIGAWYTIFAVKKDIIKVPKDKIVFPNTLPKIIVLKLAGATNMRDRVPIYLSLLISPADEKQMQLQSPISPPPSITYVVKLS